MPENKLFLIDAHALCYRSFYAIKNLATGRGQATNAVFGFVNTLRKILREYKPQYIAVCFDSKEKTNRQKQFAEYKIQRPVMPDDLISQIPYIKEVVKAFKFESFELGGYEADDIIATITNTAEKQGIEVVIVTDDKDMFQLASPKVKFYSPRKETILDDKDVEQKLGFAPAQITDFIALAGDQSDNIPGVKGIGEVTATQLIKEFGGLDDILKNISRIKKESVREKLTSQKESAIFSKQLAVLDPHVPITFQISDLRLKDPDKARLKELFMELEFRKLAQEFDLESSPESHASRTLTIIKSVSRENLVSRVKKLKKLVFLIYSGEKQLFEDPSQIAVFLGADEAVMLPMHRFGELKDILEDAAIDKVSYDFKIIFKLLLAQGIVLKGRIFDVLLAGYVLSPVRSSFTISDLAWNYLKATVGAAVDEQIQAVESLHLALTKEMEEKNLMELLNAIEVPLALVLARMEHEGVRIDVDLLESLSKECEIKIEQLVSKLHMLAHEEFNLNSPKQLSQILFEKLRLPVVKKTKTGYSTDEEVLTILAEEHEFPALILEYRQLAKLKSTYIDALPRLTDPKTNRIHAQFIQTGAETGRLSSRQPNLQDIPVRTELGRQIRRAIIPFEKDHVIVAADYSQVELRILAHLSGDKNLIKAFHEDQDIHRYTASLIFDVKLDEVTDRMRDSAKRVNFGIIYGMSAFGLAKDLKVPQIEAQEFIDKYFLRYPDVRKFMDSEIKKCEKEGFVVTLLNRRRYIPEINSSDRSVRQFAQRQAINTPVQGSAADLIKLAMINIQNEIDKQDYQAKMIISVHDELVFDVPKKEEAKIAAVIRQLMENAFKLSVPLKVDVKAGANWLDMKAV